MSVTPQRLLPRRLLQPTFQPFSSAITQLLELLTPLTGTAHEILTDTGASLGQIIKIPKGRRDPSGLLIDDALGAETPTAASRKPWIAASHEVIEDLTCRGNKREIGDLAQALAIPIEEIRIQKRGQSIQRQLVGLRRQSFHKHLLIIHAAALIQPPNIPTAAQGGRTADPTEKAMHGRVHPGHHARAVIKSLITAHTMAKQIAEKKRIGQGQGSGANLHGHHEIGEA